MEDETLKSKKASYRTNVNMTAYIEGIRAYRDTFDYGLSEMPENPYPTSSIFRQDWYAGFNDAQNDLGYE